MREFTLIWLNMNPLKAQLFHTLLESSWYVYEKQEGSLGYLGGDRRDTES